MKKQFLNFKIQKFAEGGEPTPKTYSEEEYLALKKRVDEMSTNEKNLKIQLKERMTDDEKKAQEQEALNQKLANYESQLENISVEKELLKGGFTSEEITKIIESKGNNVSLATTISTIFQAKLEQEKKKWQQELSDQTKGVNGGSNSGDEESYAVKKAKSYVKKEQVTQWGNYSR